VWAVVLIYLGIVVYYVNSYIGQLFGVEPVMFYFFFPLTVKVYQLILSGSLAFFFLYRYYELHKGGDIGHWWGLGFLFLAISAVYDIVMITTKTTNLFAFAVRVILIAPSLGFRIGGTLKFFTDKDKIVNAISLAVSVAFAGLVDFCYLALNNFLLGNQVATIIFIAPTEWGIGAAFLFIWHKRRLKGLLMVAFGMCMTGTFNFFWTIINLATTPGNVFTITYSIFNLILLQGGFLLLFVGLIVARNQLKTLKN